MLFVDVPYTVATEEAERIGVDHVARVSSAGESDVSSGVFIDYSVLKNCHRKMHIYSSILARRMQNKTEVFLDYNDNVSLCETGRRKGG